MKKRYNITLNVIIDVKQGADGRRIPRIQFIGWKHGIITKDARFIETEPIVRMTKQKMEYLGQHIFEAAKDMFYEDEELIIDSE